MVMSTIMKNENPCTLTSLPAGCRAKVARVEGSAAERSRLNSLGLTPQTDIEVIDCSCGRQIVRVRGCNLVLDDEMACHITCSLEPVSELRAGE